VDTGGVVPDDEDLIPAEIFRQAQTGIEEADAILVRRSRAIARIAELKDAVLAFPSEEQAEIVQRMRYASGGGELAQLRLAGSQRKTVAEWSQWNRISLSLPAGIPSDLKKVDCSG